MLHADRGTMQGLFSHPPDNQKPAKFQESCEPGCEAEASRAGQLFCFKTCFTLLLVSLAFSIPRDESHFEPEEARKT